MAKAVTLSVIARSSTRNVTPKEESNRRPNPTVSSGGYPMHMPKCCVIRGNPNENASCRHAGRPAHSDRNGTFECSSGSESQTTEGKGSRAKWGLLPRRCARLWQCGDPGGQVLCAIRPPHCCWDVPGLWITTL